MEGTCWACGEGTLMEDPGSGMLVCTSCGRIHDAGDKQYVNQATFTAEGQIDLRASSLVHHSSGYRDHKLAAASEIITSIAARLGLSPARADEALRLAASATDGALATPTSTFLPALAAACALLVARVHRLPLSLFEAASAASCPVSALSDLASRVAARLSLPPLPSFDYAAALDRAVRSSPSLSAVPTDKTEMILAHARFLLRCAAKWSLTTGRYPLPLIAGVAAFAAQANGVTSVSVEDIAQDISAGIVSSRRRFKELINTLVRAARAVLPWGADVNAKNLALNAPLLLRLMEMRSQSDPSDRFLESFAPVMAGIVETYSCADEDESKYFQIVPLVDEDLCVNNSVEDKKELEDFKILQDRLSDAYRNVLKRIPQLHDAGEVGSDPEKRKQWRGGLQLDQWMDLPEDGWYKDMPLEEVVDIDVGYDAPPPSFTAKMESQKRRRARIENAKLRIDAIRKAPVAIAAAAETIEKNANDSEVVLTNEHACEAQKAVKRKRGRKRKDGSDCTIRGDHYPAENSDGGKKRGRRYSCDGTYWEDCVIELLLLHGADEAEIEQGQYKRLLDLHVFGATSRGR